MKKRNYILILTLASLIFSCESKEQKAKNVVNDFLTQINDKTKTIDKDLTTKDFSIFFDDKSYYTSENWELTLKPQNDSTMIVESIGHSFNSKGEPVDITQSFYLKYFYGSWEISNTFNLVSSRINFDLSDYQWDFYWDREKFEILEELKTKLLLKVITKGNTSYGIDSRIGKLRLINNSNFDVKNIKIQIEHFDKKGYSVNVDEKFLSNIIRKNGYIDFEWYSKDCYNCYDQKYKIIFTEDQN